MERRKIVNLKKTNSPHERRIPIKIPLNKSSLVLTPSSQMLPPKHTRAQPLHKFPLLTTKNDIKARYIDKPKTPTGYSISPIKLSPLNTPTARSPNNNILKSRVQTSEKQQSISINSKIIQHIHFGEPQNITEFNPVDSETAYESLKNENKKLEFELEKMKLRYEKERKMMQKEINSAKNLISELLEIAGDRINDTILEKAKIFLENPKKFVKTPTITPYNSGKNIEKQALCNNNLEKYEIDAYQDFIKYKENAKNLITPNFMKSLSLPKS